MVRIFSKRQGTRFVDAVTLKGGVERDVVRIIDADPFLKKNLKVQEVSFRWFLRSKVVDDTFFAHLSGSKKMFSKTLDVYLYNLNRFANLRQELIFQLYKLASEEKNLKRLLEAQKKLKIWIEKLGDDFFLLYSSYHSQSRAAGIQLGMLRNHPEYKQDLLNLYLDILWTGVPRLIPLHDLGDIRIRRVIQGQSQSSSLFRTGALTLMSKMEKDYLSHYVTGTPISTMLPVFSLANNDDLSSKLMRNLVLTYRLSDRSVSEKLLENSKSIDHDTFDEFFCPFPHLENYLSNVEKYLAGCLEMKELMRQRNAGPSIIKPNDAGAVYAMNKTGFMNNTREERYVV
jgi:hypothetical protein